MATMDGSEERYKPDPDFVEDTNEPLLDITMTDSTELWLIQWPVNKLQTSDFDGKELSLKLHRDGRWGTFESSSGKSYNVVSSPAYVPDQVVLVPSASDSKVVGRISRQVSLISYPEPGEFEKPGVLNPGLSSRFEGSSRRSISRPSATSLLRRSGTNGISDDTLTSTHTIGQLSVDTPEKHSRKKRRDDSNQPSEVIARPAERSSASKPGSQVTDTSIKSEQLRSKKSKKKQKKIKVETQ